MSTRNSDRSSYLFALTAAVLFFFIGLATLNQYGYIWDTPENLLTGSHYLRFFTTGNSQWAVGHRYRAGDGRARAGAADVADYRFGLFAAGVGTAGRGVATSAPALLPPSCPHSPGAAHLPGRLARYYVSADRQIIPDEALPSLPPDQPILIIYMTGRDKFDWIAEFADVSLTPIYELKRGGIPVLKIAQTDAQTLQQAQP